MRILGLYTTNAAAEYNFVIIKPSEIHPFSDPHVFLGLPAVSRIFFFFLVAASRSEKTNCSIVLRYAIVQLILHRQTKSSITNSETSSSFLDGAQIGPVNFFFFFLRYLHIALLHLPRSNLLSKMTRYFYP